MLVSDIIGSVRARLRQRGETSAFTNANIIDYINEVLLQVSDVLEFTRKVVALTPDSNKRIYLPADCLSLEFVGTGNVEIVPLTPSEAAVSATDISSIITANGYIFMNGYLQLGTSHDVVLHYVSKIPAIDNENQEIPVREEYRIPIVNGVSELCFVELGQNDKAAYWGAKFREELSDRRHTIRQNAWKNRKYPSMPPVEV
jgi:hypothetical protein